MRNFISKLFGGKKTAKQSAEVTHNHPEGIKGAQAIASAIFLARQHTRKEDIRRYIEQILAMTCSALAMIYAPHMSLTKLVKALAPRRLLLSWIAPTTSLQSAWQSRWVATATQLPV